jgi:hypothetical protein
MGGIGTQGVFGNDALKMWMILAKCGDEAFGSMAFALIFLRAVLLDNRFGHERNHFTKIRMDDRGCQHLVSIGDRAVAVFVLPARVTVDGRGGKIPGAIDCYQIMAIEKHHRFKRLATLELSTDERERRAQRRRRNGIEALPPSRVAGRACDAIDGLQMAFCPLFVKGEQGGGFEGKHGKRRHQRIVQGNLYLGNAIIHEGGEVLMKQAEERIGTEMFASFWRHSRHRNPQPDVIHERNRFHESRMVAFMFTKSQLEGWRGY